eukprot:COSAG04_NODE_8_length_44311_cov_99.067531_5_plen_145_part_00
MTTVAQNWGGTYQGYAQGVYPITIGRYVCPESLGFACPIVNSSNHWSGNGHIPHMQETVELQDVIVHNSSDGIYSGRPVIGCNNLSSTRGVEPVPCAGPTIWPLRGSLSVWSRNRSACDLHGLGAAAAHLRVACHASEWRSVYP